MIFETLEIGTTTVQFSETLTPGWTDITSVKNIDALWVHSGKDYKFCRDRMKDFVISLGADEETGFATLSALDKTIASEHNIGTHAQQLASVGIDNLIAFGQLYNMRAYESRVARLSRARSEVYNRLYTNRNEVLDDLTNENLFTTYNQGRLGTVYGDPEGITDYIKGTSGTRYDVAGALPGLLHKGWNPVGMTLETFTDNLIEIIVNGNY